MKAIRPWSAKAEFPGLKTFILGTITMPKDARHDQIVSALEAHAALYLPPGFQIIEPICGSVFFQEADAE